MPDAVAGTAGPRGLLAGQVALITGSSRGIGASIATRFAKEAARVVLHGRDVIALSRIRAEIEQDGGAVMQVSGDLTNFANVEAIRDQIERNFGPVEILVANAGGNPVPPGPLEEIGEVAWRAVVDANLTTTFLTIKSFLPGMKARRRGNIITISSAAGRRAHPGSPIPYAAAKAAIALLTQDVAAQAGPYSIRANCIAPETILTERNSAQIPEEIQTKLREAHPIRRLGTPDDVAEAALYLASDNSAWITGIVLDIAGGAVML